MVPSSSADVTRSLRGCSRGIDTEDENWDQIKIWFYCAGSLKRKFEVTLTEKLGTVPSLKITYEG